MIYKNYLEKLFGNKTKIALARTFYKIPEKVWTVRDIARFIGIQHTTVLDNLEDLEELGLLHIGGYGKAKTIKVNKDSFIFNKIVKPLFETEIRTRDELISDLKKIINSNDIELLALFGSVAEESEKFNSDIDLLIVSKNKDEVERILTEKQSFISNKFGNELSPYIFTPKEFKSKQKTPFLKDAKKKCIILRGEWR